MNCVLLVVYFVRLVGSGVGEEEAVGEVARRKRCLTPPEGVTVVSSLTERLPQCSAGTGGLSPDHICNTRQHPTTHKHIDVDKHTMMQGASESS